MKRIITPTTRLSDYDYTSPNIYFITICTYYRKAILAKFVGEELRLTQAGLLVTEAWQQLTRYPYVQLDKFIVMPDHIHGLIHIVENQDEKTKPLSQLVGDFKSRATRLIREHCSIFKVWQPSYYEHIVRHHEQLTKVREYIEQNPQRWLLKQQNLE